MKAKIEWYQEVLELEPSSKVFFPLARLLAENGQPDEAVRTLKTGLDRHPEFFEAKLMLIELLHSLGNDVDRDTEVQSLSRLFASYPRFWEAWSACIEAGDSGRDVALAMRFIAASNKERSLSLASVLDMGLKAFAARGPVSPAEAKEAAAPVSRAVQAAADPVPAPVQPVPAVAQPATATFTARPSAADARHEASSATSASFDKIGQMQSLLQATPELIDTRDAYSGDAADADDEVEEPFTLRTRSMAEVLAEQGDTQGAVEIYQELLAAADTVESRDAIATRIDELRLGLVAGSGAQSVATAEEPPLQGKHKLLHMLELLADRLEARAQG